MPSVLAPLPPLVTLSASKHNSSVNHGFLLFSPLWFFSSSLQHKKSLPSPSFQDYLSPIFFPLFCNSSHNHHSSPPSFLLPLLSVLFFLPASINQNQFKKSAQAHAPPPSIHGIVALGSDQILREPNPHLSSLALCSAVPHRRRCSAPKMPAFLAVGFPDPELLAASSQRRAASARFTNSRPSGSSRCNSQALASKPRRTRLILHQTHELQTDVFPCRHPLWPLPGIIFGVVPSTTAGVNSTSSIKHGSRRRPVLLLLFSPSTIAAILAGAVPRSLASLL